jgi:hypothetical protein
MPVLIACIFINILVSIDSLDAASMQTWAGLPAALLYGGPGGMAAELDVNKRMMKSKWSCCAVEAPFAPATALPQLDRFRVLGLGLCAHCIAHPRSLCAGTFLPFPGDSCRVAPSLFSGSLLALPALAIPLLNTLLSPWLPHGGLLVSIY